MTEIEAIRNRHSVRKYLDKQIEPEKVEKIEKMIEVCNREGNLNLQFIADAGKTYSKLFSKVMGLGSAPSVIACIGPDDATLEERVGYYGEKIVLFAQTLGLNTCWTGTFNPKGVPVNVGADERIAIAIAIGYGENPGRERKTKSPKQVSNAGAALPDWFNFGVEMALLAPTAINQQKFDIRLNEDESVVFIDKGGIFSKVDLGIVRYHFEVGAEYIKNKGNNN